MAYSFLDTELGIPTDPTKYKSPDYDLNDLDADEEFQQRAERFLGSVGESDDIYEYLRDSDWNLYKAGKQMFDSNKFTDEQKQDYAYLRKTFDGASLGSTSQFLELIKDASIDMVTDPTLIAALLTTPITGGTSLASRTLLGKGTQESLKLLGKANSKALTRKELVEATQSGALKRAGDSAKNVAMTVSAVEAGGWMGMHNHATQNTQINTGLRKAYSSSELAGSTVLGTLTGGVVGRGFQKWNNHKNPALNWSNEPAKMNKIQYAYNKTLDTFLSNTILGTARQMRTFEKLGIKKAKEFANVLDADSQLVIGKRNTEAVKFSFPERLSARRGSYMFGDNGFWKAIEDMAPDGVFREIDEAKIIAILRGGSEKGASKEIKQTAKKLRKWFDGIAKDAEDAGYGKLRIEDYFPREWNRQAIEADRIGFENRLVDKRIVDRSEVSGVVDEMLNKHNQLYSSHSNLMSHGRKFENMKDVDFEDFLVNDLVAIGATYGLNAANTIQTKLSFLGGSKGLKNTRVVGSQEIDGKDIKVVQALAQSKQAQFEKIWIEPLDAELRAKTGRRLSGKDKARMYESFKSATGDVNFFKGKIIQGSYDTLKLANAMAYLPLATVSSASEALITLTKAPTKNSVKNMQYQLENGVRFLTTDLKSVLKERRGLSEIEANREANKAWIAVDDVQSDKTNRLTGEALQTQSLNKVARAFYKLNLLMPWTKTIELAAFKTGKDIIEENIATLSKMADSGIKVFDDTDLFLKSINESRGAYKRIIKKDLDGVYTGSIQDAAKEVQYLKETLYDLGIDPKKGVKWFKEGASKEANFYGDITMGGGRFSRGVILPTSREFSKVPTFMTHPRYDIFTQFLRYPAAFSNTVLKNFARDTINNPKANAPKVGSFVIASTGIARATNYWRSSAEAQEQLDYGINRRRESTGPIGQAIDKVAPMSYEETKRSLQRVGLLGPLEYGVRFFDSFAYNENAVVSASSLGGPIVGDITGSLIYGRGFFETLSRKTPLRGLKNPLQNTFGAEPFSAMDEKARELDDRITEILQNTGTLINEGRVGYHGGGHVKKRKKYNQGSIVTPIPPVPVKPDFPEEAQQIVDYMLSKNNPIFNERSIPGLLGNINVESAGSYSYQQQQVNGNAWGIWQLDHSKKEDYFNYLQEQDREDSMEAQVDYAEETMMSGRNIGGKNAENWRGIMENGTVAEVADMWARQWERPNPNKNPQWERRISTAEKAALEFFEKAE